MLVRGRRLEHLLNLCWGVCSESGLCMTLRCVDRDNLGDNGEHVSRRAADELKWVDAAAARAPVATSLHQSDQVPVPTHRGAPAHQESVADTHAGSPTPSLTLATQQLFSLTHLQCCDLYNSYCRGNICFIIFMCLLPTGVSRPKIWTSRYSIQNCHSKMVPDMWHWSLSAEE